MKLDGKHPLRRDIKIIDEMGHVIPYCATFDTDTKVAEIYLTAQKENGKNTIVVSRGQALKVSVKLPNAKAIQKSTGQELK